ncbi:MAG: type transport system permease protein [Actinomycetota bacterium]|jgi:ABC-type transport system involved in multi-copper enzyme maturation permease subunit|nr:type transport system permease protein [Actinomycetota bacterium]
MTAVAQKVTPARVVLSEWTKLRTLRSTVWSLLAAVVFVIGFSVLVPSVVRAHWPPRDPRDAIGFDPVGVSLVGGFFAQLAIGVLGVLLMTGEYATGMIRATLAAVPKRLPVLWAKALVFTVTTLVLMIPTCLVGFFIGQSILSSKHIQTSLGQPHVSRAVIGSALYIAGIGLLGLGLGALLRNTAGAISTLFGLLFVVPVVVHFLPASWSDAIGKYLPSNAGQGIYSLHVDPTQLAPWTGFAVFLLYAVVALALAAVGLVRRDA